MEGISVSAGVHSSSEGTKAEYEKNYHFQILALKVIFEGYSCPYNTPFEIPHSDDK